jgi:hypothetical protein
VLGRLGDLIRSQGMEPSEVAEQVVQAIRAERFYVLTHPDVALTGMRQRLRWMETGTVPETPFVDARHCLDSADVQGRLPGQSIISKSISRAR